MELIHADIKQGDMIRIHGLLLDEKFRRTPGVWAVCISVNEVEQRFEIVAGSRYCRYDGQEHSIEPGWKDVIIDGDRGVVVPEDKVPDEVWAAIAERRLLGEVDG
jgi:hypothetical protein